MIHAVLDDCSGGLQAGFMPGISRQKTLLGPSAVAIHNDSYMFWYLT